MKRELRTLTIEDRENFLNAAAVMWKYNSADGLEKYGVGYTSIEKFAAIHSLASNDIMCDGFHEGAYMFRCFFCHYFMLRNVVIFTHIYACRCDCVCWLSVLVVRV